MTNAYVLHEVLPTLHEPVLAVALSGWIDATGAAASAMECLIAECEARTVATFDGDMFVDYRARRPVMHLRDGVNTHLDWQDIQLKVGRDPDGHDVALLCGPEPDSQWRRFADVVSTVAVELGITKMVALGAYPFATPHTRPPRLSSSSPSVAVLAPLQFLKNSVDVPAGMGAVLEQSLHAKDIASVGLWVQVPHYVSSMSYPAASVALLSGLQEVSGIAVQATELRRESIVQRERLDQLVAANEDHIGMLRQLEELYDTSATDTPITQFNLPSGDELAAELERYLREQGE